MTTNDLTSVAIARIKRGDPLPLDMTTKLLSNGIDVEALEDKYSQ